MSKLTLDEAIIEHIQKADSYHKAMPNYGEAADHRQLAEWLKELKSLRKKAKHLTEWNRKLIDYKNEIICKWGESQEELQEAKRLLKLAVEDIESLRPYLAEPYLHMCNEKWRYADEAKKLLNE